MDPPPAVPRATMSTFNPNIHTGATVQWLANGKFYIVRKASHSVGPGEAETVASIVREGEVVDDVPGTELVVVATEEKP